MHTYVCTYTCIHTYMHAYMHVCTYTHAYIHAYMHAYIHTYMYIHTYIQDDTDNTYIHACIHTCIHAYMYIYTYIHTFENFCQRCHDARQLQNLWKVSALVLVLYKLTTEFLPTKKTKKVRAMIQENYHQQLCDAVAAKALNSEASSIFLIFLQLILFFFPRILSLMASLQRHSTLKNSLEYSDSIASAPGHITLKCPLDTILVPLYL